MIKTFKEFLKIIEINEDVNQEQELDSANYMLDDETMDYLDKHHPDFICDDKYLSKISRIVSKKMMKSGLKAVTYPYAITIDGNEGCLIKSSNDYSIICFRDTYKKKIAIFKNFDISNKNQTSMISFSTKKLGFKDVVESVINFILCDDNAVSEALMPSSSDTSAVVPYPTLYKSVSGMNIKMVMAFLKAISEDGSKNAINNLAKSKPGGDDIYSKVYDSLKGAVPRNGMQARRIEVFFRTVACGTAPNPEDYRVEIPWYGCVDESGAIAGIEIPKGDDDEYSGMDADTRGTSIGVVSEEKESFAIKDKAAIADANVTKFENKMNILENATDAICKYIKSNGKDDGLYKRYFGFARGMLITGTAGIGKTMGLKNSLAKNGMKENYDYYMVGNSSTGAYQMYTLLYKNSDNLLIFDDTPELFNSELKAAFWKKALETNESSRVLTKTSGIVRENPKAEAMFYNVGDADRQQRYFKEIGKKSLEEKNNFLNKKIKELRKKYTTEDPITGEESRLDETTIRNMALKAWDEIEAATIPKIPDRFTYNGFVFVITNLTFDDFRNSCGNHWDALQRRFKTIQIEPSYRTIWEWLKKKIIANKDDASIPDESKLVPPRYVDEFVQFVSDIMDGYYNDGKNTYGVIDYGRLATFMEQMWHPRGDEPFDNYKDEILESMRKTNK